MKEKFQLLSTVVIDCEIARKSVEQSFRAAFVGGSMLRCCSYRIRSYSSIAFSALAAVLLAACGGADDSPGRSVRPEPIVQPIPVDAEVVDFSVGEFGANIIECSISEPFCRICFFLLIDGAVLEWRYL